MSPLHATRNSRLIPLLLLALLLCRSERAAAQETFLLFVPTSGDRLFVGPMTFDTFTALQGLPLPQFPNQKFCGTVQLASGALREAYVPTAAERAGDFSAFAGLLHEPGSDTTAFPGGIIPRSRLPGIFAWRIAAPAGGTGPNCLAYNGPIPFTSLFYESGFVNGVRQLAVGSTSLTFDYSPSGFLAGNTNTAGDTQTIALYSTGASVPFLASVSLDTPIGGNWLSIRPTIGATPALLSVAANPTGLPPGTYTGSVLLRQDSDSQTLAVRVTLIVRPAATLMVQRDVTLQYDLSTPLIPPPTAPINVRSTNNIPLNFTVKPILKTPVGFNWLSVDVSAGVTPAVVNLTVNPAGLGVGTYLAVVRFGLTSSGCEASTSPRMATPAPPPCDSAQMAVILDIRGAPLKLIAKKTINFPLDANPSSSFQVVAGPGVVGSPDALKFSTTWTVTGAECVDWLSVRPPTGGIGVGIDLTVDVNRGLLSTPGDFIGYVGISGDVGETTAGAVVMVSLAGPPANPNALIDAVPDLKEQAIRSAGADPLPQATAATNQIVAQIADGNGWKTAITLVNTDAASSQAFTLRFWPGAATLPGVPLLLDGADQISDLALTKTIPAGGSLTLQTRGADGGPYWQGWAELISSAAIGGTSILRKPLSSNQDAEGAVPIKPASVGRFLLPFDNTAPYSTSLAVLNPSGTYSTTIQAAFRDQFGTPLSAPATFTLGPRGHDVFALRDRFPNVAGKRGVAEFSAACGQIAGLGLLFHDPLNGFTSFETIDPDAGGGVTAIPHLVAGSGWETSVLLVNTDSQNPARFTMRFFPGKDTPADQAPAVEGRPRRELTISDTVPIGGSLNLDVRGSGGGLLWQGWAEMNVTSGAIAGMAIFRRQVTATDFAEAAVPVTALKSLHFLMPFDNLGNFQTTLAVANPNAQQSNTVQTSLRDESGQPSGSPGAIPLQPKGYDNFALADRFPRTQSLRGVVDLASPGMPILGIGLRFSPRLALTSAPILRK